MHKLASTYPNARILLFGDLNYPDIHWRNFTNSTITCHGEEKNFLDVCLNFNLVQLVSQPTHVAGGSASILDLILTNSPEYISSINCLPEISDHSHTRRFFSFTSPWKQMIDKTINLNDKGNYAAIIEDLGAFFPEYESTFHTRSKNENWLVFKNKLNQLSNMFIPKVTFHSHRNKPWFSRHLKQLENKKQRLFRRAKRNDTPATWDKYFAAETLYFLFLRNAKHSFIAMT